MDSVGIKELLELCDKFANEGRSYSVCPLEIGKHLFGVDLTDYNYESYAHDCLNLKDHVLFDWMYWLGFEGCHRIQRLNFLRFLKKNNIPYKERCPQIGRRRINIFLTGPDMKLVAQHLDNERGTQLRKYLFVRERVFDLHSTYLNLERYLCPHASCTNLYLERI